MTGPRETHLTDEQLDDLADGVLAPSDRASAERHVADCARCRRTLDETRALVAWSRREAVTEPAPAELWPMVASSTIHLAATRRRVVRSMRGVLLACAISLSAATALVTWQVARWTFARRAVAGSTAPVAPRAPEAPRPEGGGTHAGHPIVPRPPR